MDITNLKEKFKLIFNKQSEKVFFAPGRINLIGEHTDYNGGYVFPCAISLGVYGVVAERNDHCLNFYSLDFSDKGIIHSSLDNLSYKTSNHWANYLIGMIKVIMDKHFNITHGLDILISGDLPNGAGLSSSAAIELLMGQILNKIFNLGISNAELAQYGKLVENKFIGVNSGIMDQFAVAMGKKDNAILLNTTTMNYQYVHFKLDNYKIVIMNTNKQRELQTSKYNERRAECDQALRIFQSKININTLCDLNKEQFDEYTYLLNNDLLIRRARHAVFENQRALEAQQALQKQDLTTFGHLMNASHVSLHYDYEVTGLELDTLVEAAWQQNGVLGARMCGAGFGGCAIAIVECDHINEFCEQVNKKYRMTIGHDATFYIAHISDGPKEIGQ